MNDPFSIEATARDLGPEYQYALRALRLPEYDFEPRRIMAPTPRHAGSREIADRLSSLWANRYRPNIVRDLGPMAFEVLRTLGETGVNSFYLDESIARDLVNTKLPDDMRFRDLLMPFDAFVIVPPSGLIPGSETTHITVGRVQTVLDGRSHDGVGFLVDTKTHMLRALAEADEPLSAAGEADLRAQGDHEASPEAPFLRAAIGAIFMLTYHRDSVTESKMIKRIRCKRREGKIDLFEPRWIGRWMTRGERSDTPGEHRSPRSHWRRGHWRQQRIGQRRMDIRLTWIRPSLVNPGENNADN